MCKVGWSGHFQFINNQSLFYMRLFYFQMLLTVVLMALSVCIASGYPGGYTGLGGVYDNLDQTDDYFEQAKEAAKLAWDIVNDESLIEKEEKRPVRQSPYDIPTTGSKPIHQTGQLQQGFRIVSK